MTEEECIPALKALAEESRWRIVRVLLHRECTITELVEALNLSQYNISKHVRILREAGIIQKTKDGKHVRCQVKPELRKQLEKADELDLGCCSFRFDDDSEACC